MRAAFEPQPFEVLVARMVEEFHTRRAIFDLPRRCFWRGHRDLDLSVRCHGERASNPAGPAAGPHTQLAQNLALAWLAGARVLELKTIQVNDRITVPRPCIDVANIGFNVEWSQELPLESSLEQYTAGWFLVHILKAMGVTGAPVERHDTVFDCSVGYDFEGIRSAKLARALDAIHDGGPVLARLRDRLPSTLRRVADVEVPSRISSCVTLSTFHGCPPEEIERIVDHLFERHDVHVVVKLNPTLLGYEFVDDLLRGRLGYEEIRLEPESFVRDLEWDHALALFERLSRAAAHAGRTLGVKFTNTLVVKNHKRVFQDEVMYLSGQPLHVLAITLADRFAHATGGRHPFSFSGGIDADNFHEAVACGMSPVTACTDLLRPTGYRRLPRYLKSLEVEMERIGVHTVAGYVLARAGMPAVAGEEPAAEVVREAGLRNLAEYAGRLPENERYHAVQNRGMPRREPSRLSSFDCLSCNACVVVCPNDAVFKVKMAPQAIDTVDLVLEEGRTRSEPSRFETARDEQWAIHADACNDCGNCDVFCPEHGGPYRAKPRFHGSRASFEAAAPADGLLVERGGKRVLGRFAGVVHEIRFGGGGALFTDGVIDVALDRNHWVVRARGRAERPGHRLSLARYHAMRLLRDAVMGGVNPVSAQFLPVLEPRKRGVPETAASVPGRSSP